MSTAAGTRPRPLHTVLEVTGLTVLAFVFMLVLGVAFVVPMFVLGYDVESTTVLVGATAVGQVGLLLLAFAYTRWRGIDVGIRVPSGRHALAVVGGTVLALAVAIGLSFLLAVLGLVPGSVIDDVGTEDPTFFLALAVTSVAVVAPAEELFFRGAIQGRLRQRFGPVSAVVGSSLLFGSVHLTNYTGSIVPVLAGSLLIASVGAVLGALYEWTDNLAVPIAVHAVYNVILLVTAYAVA